MTDKAIAALPSNVEMEEALLGSLVTFTDDIVFVQHVGLIPADMFLQKHKITLESIYHLHDKSVVDMFMLIEDLERVGFDDIFSESATLWITGLMGLEGSFIRNSPYHAERIVELSIARKLIRVKTKEVQELYEQKRPLGEIIEDMESAMVQTRRPASSGKSRKLKHVSRGLDRFLDRQEEMMVNGGNPRCFSTGLKSLDKKIGGWYDNDFYILAGRPGMGKTALLIWFAIESAKAGKNTCVFSAEMAEEDMIDRMVSVMTGIDSFLIRTGQATHKLSDMVAAASLLRDFPLYIDDTPAINIEELKSKAKRRAIEDDIDVIYADHVQKLKAPNHIKERRHQVGYIGQEFKNLARELRLPIIAASHVGKQVDSRPDKRPFISDLSESDVLSQEADTILTMFREYYYDKECDMPALAELDPKKNRFGDTGVINIFFNQTNGQIGDLDPHAEAKKLPGYENGNGNGAMPPQPDFIKKELF